jgi:hypothetical protein
MDTSSDRDQCCQMSVGGSTTYVRTVTDSDTRHSVNNFSKIDFYSVLTFSHRVAVSNVANISVDGKGTWCLGT